MENQDMGNVCWLRINDPMNKIMSHTWSQEFRPRFPYDPCSLRIPLTFDLCFFSTILSITTLKSHLANTLKQFVLLFLSFLFFFKKTLSLCSLGWPK